MSKILIDKEKLEAKIAELEKYPNDVNNGKAFELESILQQGEEYNENEAVEFLSWFLKHPSIEYFKKLSNFYYKGKYYTIQELFKLYKNERKIN